MVTLVDGKVLPAASANYELSSTMFFEHLDYAGSIQYAYAAISRAFNAPPAKVCTNGSVNICQKQKTLQKRPLPKKEPSPQLPSDWAVEPVLQHQCPLPTAIAGLKPRAEVKVDELCKDAKDCGWSEPPGNCPIDSVYKKVEKGCRGHGAAFCAWVAKAIAMGSTVCLILAVVVPVFAVLKKDFEESYKEPLGCVCLLCVGAFLFAAIYLGVLLPVCWAVGGTGAVITFWVMTALGVITAVSLAVCISCDTHSGITVTLMVVPVLNVYVAWKIGAENAVEVTKAISPVCLALRIVRDIPRVIFSCLDMYFFGISWFAVFDLITSTMEVTYHLLAVLCKLLLRLMGALMGALRDTKTAFDAMIVEPTPATVGAAS